jgi:hypothetical protein
LGTFAALFLLYSTQVFSRAFWLALLPLVLAALLTCGFLGHLLGKLRGSAEQQAIAEVKRAARFVPLWITSLALASLLAAAVFFLIRSENR